MSETNIVYQIILSKIKEKMQWDKSLDITYTNEKKKVKDELKALRAALELHKNDTTDVPTKGKGKRGRKAIPFRADKYPYTGSIKNKMLFALHDVNHFMHVKDIANYIVHKEPGLNAQVIKDQLGKHFYKHRNAGLVVSYGDNNRNILWGLPTWKDGDGEVIPTYLPEYVGEQTTLDLTDGEPLFKMRDR